MEQMRKLPIGIQTFEKQEINNYEILKLFRKRIVKPSATLC